MYYAIDVWHGAFNHAIYTLTMNYLSYRKYFNKYTKISQSHFGRDGNGTFEICRIIF